MIPLFDLHCDTLLELYKKNEDIQKNSLHISFEKAKNFNPYIQISAIWSPSSLFDEEAYQNYIKVRDYLIRQNIYFATSASGLRQKTFILAIEDARLLNGKIERLYDLYNDGVRFLTLNWQGSSIIGGAWNTTYGLTQFGKEVAIKCFDLGIIPDISHSSIKTSEELCELCSTFKKPLIASHSNSFSICNHKRNLNDNLFKNVVKMNGLVGISLAKEHISSSNIVTSDDVLKHIYHYLSLDGENTIALGCDFDGVSALPIDISSISELEMLYYKIESSFGERIAKKIFFYNAYNFIRKNLV